MWAEGLHVPPILNFRSANGVFYRYPWLDSGYGVATTARVARYCGHSLKHERRDSSVTFYMADLRV